MQTFIEPDWPAPGNVTALCTTRLGGHSSGAFSSFNLGHHVGDEPLAVDANRTLLGTALSANGVSWLTQVHGRAVVEAGQGFPYPVADAQWSSTPALGCAVLTADCLPVLFCNSAGTAVAAAHAGWRGLLAGVLESTVAAMPAAPGELLAWLGPAIGPGAFEVGPEVRAAYVDAAPGAAAAAAVECCFVPNPDREGYLVADLYALARLRLAAAGVTRIFGGEYCTYSDPERFFSYRRDGQTGRMASVILLS